MPTTHPPRVCRLGDLLILALAVAGLLPACAASPAGPELGRAQAMQAAARDSELARLKQELRDKEAQLAALAKRAPRGSELAQLALALIEKETLIAALEKKYNEAVQEVVRTKAKLHSLESKAEAASTMAEAEVALKALRAKWVSLKGDPDVGRAGQLLEMSAREFRNENYGGALYLASQAKALVSVGQDRLTDRAQRPIVAGEVPFALPLPLQAAATSNVRQGPGLDAAVAFTVARGAFLVGHSYKGEWVRVEDEAGRAGWIHQTLVGRRPAARP